ncbi:hypothetical protein AJ80_07002 [Polytolypa hystricis UAMH7299]|uniref:Uncharacterized protein n=1 Tax=Polytolypa hystricis (strain UAMH7299) TaxID=1447883 RepID=A0A2B7XSJ9_POLH7|nr:hypothetical protein AJ80_07002 [Polytolypa hystricis UAMH7299]
MLNLFKIASGMLLLSSAYASPQFDITRVTPGTTCEPTKVTVTSVITTVITTLITTSTTTSSTSLSITEAPYSCFTSTVTQLPPNIKCPIFNTKACDIVQCERPETLIIPCPDECCPVTRTVPEYTGCQTACDTSCPTVTISCETLFPPFPPTVTA